jgi:hypothetical protein
MSELAVYSAAEVTFNFAGIFVDRAAEGTKDFVTIKQSGPVFTVKKGIGGGASRARQYPHSIVTVSLRQTSRENALLSAVHNLDKATSTGAGIAPLYIADRLGTHKLIETQAFISGDPEVKYGSEEQELDWELICPDPEQFIGSH